MQIAKLTEVREFISVHGKIVFQIKFEPYEISERLFVAFSEYRGRVFCAVLVENLGQVIFDKDTFCDLVGTNVFVDKNIDLVYAQQTLLELLGAQISDIVWSAVRSN